jgi:hypothetical protein
MFWTVRGTKAIIALRCCRINGSFEDYWERDRVAGSIHPSLLRNLYGEPSISVT